MLGCNVQAAKYTKQLHYTGVEMRNGSHIQRIRLMQLCPAPGPRARRLPRDWDWELTKWSTGAVFHTHLLDASVSPLPIHHSVWVFICAGAGRKLFNEHCFSKSCKMNFYSRISLRVRKQASALELGARCREQDAGSRI